MANLSDAWGTITVQKVGKEFLEFLKTVQGKEEDAYYKLCEINDFIDIVPDSDGDAEFEFCTMGRWNYGSNLKGYLDGTWMEQDDKSKKAYAKFIKALKKKNGVVVVEYTDSDGAMDWMGKGVAQLEVVEGEARYSEDFNEQSISISGYADLHGEDQYWALERLKGDDAAEAYDKFVKEFQESNKGVEVPNPDTWYDTIYEEV